MPAGVKDTTRDFLRHADLVKFAKDRPECDAARHDLQRVRDCIDQTRLDEPDDDSRPQADAVHGGSRR